MTKPSFSFIVSILAATAAIGQHAVHIDLKKLPAYHPAGSTIYLAGSFNGWNPKDDLFAFKQLPNGTYAIDLKLEQGNYEYKVTRGGWDMVECRKDGTGVQNRVLNVANSTDIQLEIEEWKDRFPEKPKPGTASKNVHIIDTSFWIPQLKRQRRIWIYLPAGYDNNVNNSRYDVLYMHDGQNLFDDATSFSGEWGVDEALDSSKAQLIVVGIDNGGDKRMNEYNPYDHTRFGAGEGNAYVDFIVKTLKPFIDKNYRTKKGKENTLISGSSMGGLISMYAILKYPKIFGGAGIFSPSFWIAPDIYKLMKLKGKKVKANLYFFAGKLEGESMVPDMLKAFSTMASVSKSKMQSVIRDEGKHNESTWRKEFPQALYFMTRGELP